jgi:hypothetical protein
MTLSLSDSINDTQHNNSAWCHYAECRVLFIIIVKTIMRRYAECGGAFR